MQGLAKRALTHTIFLAESARDFGIQAAKLADHALAVAKARPSDSDHAAAELYSVTASLAQRFSALAERARTPIRNWPVRPVFSRLSAAHQLPADGNRVPKLLGESVAPQGPGRPLHRSRPLPGDEDHEARTRLAAARLSGLSRSKCREYTRSCSSSLKLCEDPAAAVNSAILREFQPRRIGKMYRCKLCWTTT